MTEIQIYTQPTQVRLLLTKPDGSPFEPTGTLSAWVRSGGTHQVTVEQVAPSEFRLVFPQLPAGWGQWELAMDNSGSRAIMLSGSVCVLETLSGGTISDDLTAVVDDGQAVQLAVSKGIKGDKGDTGDITPELQELADSCEDNLRDSLVAAQNAQAASQAAGVHEAGSQWYSQTSAASATEAAGYADASEASALDSEVSALDSEASALDSAASATAAGNSASQAAQSATSAAASATTAQNATATKLNNFGVETFQGTQFLAPNLTGDDTALALTIKRQHSLLFHGHPASLNWAPTFVPWPFNQIINAQLLRTTTFSAVCVLPQASGIFQFANTAIGSLVFETAAENRDIFIGPLGDSAAFTSAKGILVRTALTSSAPTVYTCDMSSGGVASNLVKVGTLPAVSARTASFRLSISRKGGSLAINAGGFTATVPISGPSCAGARIVGAADTIAICTNLLLTIQ